MTPRATFIRVRNWERFQHYSDRRPPWVKLHVEVLDNEQFMAFSPATKWLAVTLLLLASRTSNVIPLNADRLAHESRLTRDQTMRGMRELLQSRFVEPLGRKRAASSVKAVSKSSRARTRSASASVSLSSSEEPQPQELVAHFVDYSRSIDAEPPRSVIGQMARQIGKLLAEGFSDELVRRASELLAEKGLNPASLPSLVLQAQREGKSQNGQGRIGDITKDRIAELAEEVFSETG